MDVLNTELLTLDEIATALRLNIETPRRWCRSGKLASVKVGKSYRVPRAAFDAFIAGGMRDQTGKLGSQEPEMNPPTERKKVAASQQRRP